MARVRRRDRALVAARRICHSCPVLPRCEQACMGQDSGFWAGMTEKERDTRWYGAHHTSDREHSSTRGHT